MGIISQEVEAQLQLLFIRCNVVHLIHLAGGVISLLIIIYNHFKQKYNSSQTLELNLVYWHFLDLLWVYLFLFLYFFK
jgi:cytochrome c oxidase subunit 3